jgi:AAA ATPase domain
MYISSFAIAGYRSLKDVKVPKMLQVCIFHGLNNSGKSNLLSAIETIFRRKTLVEETTVAETTKHERQGSFWQGRITNFRDNFYANGREDIRFSVSVAFSGNELAFLSAVLRELHTSLAVPDRNKILTLKGRIRYVDEDNADMALESAAFRSHVVFREDDGGKKVFFPSVKGFTAEQRLNYFEVLMDLLSDSFTLLPSDRYFANEQGHEESMAASPLSPESFQRWLFKLSLNRSSHAAFEEIKKMFNTAPFVIGELGFSQERDEIHVMVQEQMVRLPISRLGSGYQQVLYIIANLVLNKRKMLGIEELEINLSPKLQQVLFEKLKKHIYHGSDLATQIIMTSHSDYFGDRGDVRCFEVEHNGEYTVVNSFSRGKRAAFFSRSGNQG